MSKIFYLLIARELLLRICKLANPFRVWGRLYLWARNVKGGRGGWCGVMGKFSESLLKVKQKEASF